MIELAAIVSFTVAGALWRWWDGTSGHIGSMHIPGAVRSALGALLCLGAAYLAGGAWALPAGALMGVALWLGYTKWESFRWMALRFGLPGLGTAFWGFTAISQDPWVLTYAPLCACAGISYPVLLHFNVHDGYARLILGGSVVGGLFLL